MIIRNVFRGARAACFFAIATGIQYGPNSQVQAQNTSGLTIAPLGDTVELELKTANDDSYILESQGVLLDSEEWKSLMQFRGNAQKPRNWVDPICGDQDSKFFRLRKLLAAPRAEVSNFRLIDVSGKAHELYYEWPAKGIVLVLIGDNPERATECREELDSLRALYDEGELVTWIVSVSELKDREALAQLTSGFPEALPVLQDINHVVTRTLGATDVTPEALLIDPKDWSIAYRGPTKVSIETGESTVELTPLRDAVSELLEGRTPTIAQMAVVGDPSGVDLVDSKSYSEHIGPLLLKNCFPCHAEGDIAPWSMDNYSTILEYSGLIKSAVLAGEMPPWHADPKFHAMSNSKALTKDEIATLIDWLDRGSPRGEGPDPLEEHPGLTNEDWPLGQPDAIISLPAFQVPANGTVDYQYIRASSPFTNDVWLKAVSIKPGNRSVVHHCLVFTGSLSEVIQLSGGLNGFFAGYVPGMEQVPFPEGTGKRLKRSDLIVFQMHYTVSGKAATDVTQMGLYLSNTPPERELITGSAFNTDFVIEPQLNSVGVSAQKRFDRASTIYEVSPHMHYRGSSAKYTLAYPDGTSEVLINVPAYFFDWQALYRLESPIEVPAGTMLFCEGTFDNSKQNRFNPDPNATVTFGEQSWEEMFIGYINFSER